MSGARGKHEQALDLAPASERLDRVEQTLPGAGSAMIGVHHQSREFRHAAFVLVERGGSDDDSVVFKYVETIDFHFEQIAATLDQSAICFERLDEAQNAADILDASRAQLFQWILGHHG